MSTDFAKLLENILQRTSRESERKQDRSRRTEQQILNAALRVFGRDGISRTRISDIAAEAGISTSTLYEYHASKEDLAYAVPMSFLSTFYAEYAKAVAGKHSAHDRILTYLSLSADFARRNADWGRLFYLEIWPSVLVKDSELSESVGDFARILVLLIRQGIDEGIIAGDADAHETAAVLIGGCNQVIITWLLYRRPRNLTKAGAAIVLRVLAMMKAEAEAQVSKRTKASKPPARAIT